MLLLFQQNHSISLGELGMPHDSSFLEYISMLGLFWKIWTRYISLNLISNWRIDYYIDMYMLENNIYRCFEAQTWRMYRLNTQTLNLQGLFSGHHLWSSSLSLIRRWKLCFSRPWLDGAKQGKGEERLKGLFLILMLV